MWMFLSSSQLSATEQQTSAQKGIHTPLHRMPLNGPSCFVHIHWKSSEGYQDSIPLLKLRGVELDVSMLCSRCDAVTCGNTGNTSRHGIQTCGASSDFLPILCSSSPCFITALGRKILGKLPMLSQQPPPATALISVGQKQCCAPSHELKQVLHQWVSWGILGLCSLTDKARGKLAG